MHRQSSIGEALAHIRPCDLPTILHYLKLNMQSIEIFVQKFGEYKLTLTNRRPDPHHKEMTIYTE